jgi:type II secretory pathway pseudopilin PulG
MCATMKTKTIKSEGAFTLVEMLAIVMMACLLTCMMLPALARTRPQNYVLTCRNHHRQLIDAWRMYADDQSDLLLYNMGVTGTKSEVSQATFRNWANDVLDWTTAADNTNRTLLEKGVVTPYLGTNSNAYKCPADVYLSSVQNTAGWTERVRSISMNAFVGPYQYNQGDRNQFFSQYRQWLKSAQFAKPAEAWVFIDEQPDSINDGLFLNNPSATAWQDLPGSHHNGCANLSFADSHTETHKWLSNTSRYPIGFAYGPTKPFDALGVADFQWLLQLTSVLY